MSKEKGYYMSAPCNFNPAGVMCLQRQGNNCDECGWNPEVAQARLEKIIEDMKNPNREESTEEKEPEC